MPEGHTIHRLAADHRRDLAGHLVAVTSPQGRAVALAARLDGRVLEEVEAYGKHLFYDWGRGDLLHVHLGLFGRFVRFDPPAPQPGAMVRLRMAGALATIDLSGAPAVELVDPAWRDALLDRLGPDPLRPDADPERAWSRLRRRRGTIGGALMDQAVVAGVGNVYRAEVLAVHGIHPERPAASVSREEFDSIWSTLVGWLTHGVEDQVIITVEPETLGKPRAEIVKGEALNVYRQDRCRRCGGEVRRWDLAGRWAYACETCQPPAQPVQPVGPVQPVQPVGPVERVGRRGRSAR